MVPARSNSVQCAALLLATWSLIGCANPLYVGRDYLAGELESRMGYEIGPESPPGEIAVPDSVQWDDGLSEEEAVALGLWNNPAYQELLADLHITYADLIEAQQLRNPQVTTMLPLSVKQWELTLLLPLDVILLRPHRVQVAELESQRVAERLVQDGLNVVRDVRWAYVDLATSQQRAQLAKEGERLQRQIVKVAEARLQAGAVSDLDVMPFRLEVLVNQDDVARAEEEMHVARDRLRFLLGAATAPGDLTTIPFEAGPDDSVDVESLVGEAITARPDLRAVQLAIAAAQQRARLTQWDFLNIQGALPDINQKGIKGFEAGPGLQMVLPIFNQNQGATARACAEGERLERQYIRLRDTIAMEVRQAHARLERARLSLRLIQSEMVPQAEAASASARKAIAEDGIPLLLVLESSRQLIQARQRELTATADVRRAVAELERCVGRRLFEYAPAPTAGESS